MSFHRYVESYKAKPPTGTPVRNMLRALRMHPWHNNADDWARLHTTEMFLNK